MSNSRPPYGPALYIVPLGFIELRRAIEETVKQLFGAKYVSDLAPAEAERELSALNWKLREGEARDEDKKFFKGSRSRRREIVNRLLWQAFKNHQLQTYLRRDGTQPEPLDASYWREWEPSWRPFALDPLGKPGEDVYLLMESEWRSHIKSISEKRCSKIPQATLSIVAVDANTNNNSADRPQFNPIKNPPGPQPKKLQAAKDSILAGIDKGDFTINELKKMKQKELTKFYLAGRTLLVRARLEVLNELANQHNSNITATKDK